MCDTEEKVATWFLVSQAGGYPQVLFEIAVEPAWLGLNKLSETLRAISMAE